MATAAGNENEDMYQSDSLTQESDEIQEMYCEHCEKELGIIVTADGFCVECVEYLCSTCIRYHKKYKPDHTLQDSANMPQDFCFEKCQIHTSELIKFHCNSCDKSACAQCRADMHNDCTIEHIPTLLKSMDMNDEARQIQLLIDQNLAELATSKDNTSAKLEKVYTNKRNASASIKQHKESLQSEVEDVFRKHLYLLEKKREHDMENYDKRRAALLTQLEKEKEKIHSNHLLEKKKLQDEIRLTEEEIKKRENQLNRESEKLKQTDEQKLQTVLSKANKTEADLTELEEILTQKMKTRQKSGVFLTLNKVKKDFEKLKIDSKDVKKDTEINNYEFQPEKDKVENLSQRTNIKFGSIVEKPHKIIPLQSIPAKSDKDKTKSKITGLCKLSGNYLVAADNNNDSIKLIDTTKNTISCVFRLKSKPFGVAKVDDNEVAVTLPYVGKIQFLSMKQDELSLDQEIPVKKSCHGIVYNKPNLIVIFTNYPDKVQILEMDGTMLKTFSSPQGHIENIGLSSINHMIYIPEKDLTIQSSWFITKLSMNGEILSREKIPVSLDIAIDKLGTIYMCNISGSAIIQLSADLKTKHELHLQPENYIKMPRSLFYCNEENKLYVGTERGDIYVFKIEKS